MAKKGNEYSLDHEVTDTLLPPHLRSDMALGPS